MPLKSISQLSFSLTSHQLLLKNKEVPFASQEIKSVIRLEILDRLGFFLSFRADALVKGINSSVLSLPAMDK